MHIKVEKVGEIQSKESKSGKPYQFFEVMYDADGRVAKKMFFPKDKIGKILLNAKEGEEFEVALEKDGDYWNWTDLSKAGASEASSATPKTNGKTTSAPVKSTYETADERAARQVLIVRQSSLSNAVAYSGQQKTPLNRDQVFALAEEFVDFVFQVGFDSKPQPGTGDDDLETVPSVN